VNQHTRTLFPILCALCVSLVQPRWFQRQQVLIMGEMHRGD
jgi:hypothetical protein